MAEYDVKCPGCGAPISASTESELISKVKQHAKEHHPDMKGMTDQQILDMAKQEAK